MDGTVSIGSITPTATSIKPRVRSGSEIARCHARDLRDIRMLRVRSRIAADDLIGSGAGYRNEAHELECALRNQSFDFTLRERANLQADADSHRGLELACRDELAELSSWADLAKCSSWKELAQEAARRESIA
jgi:hypothetical protein